MGFHRGELFQIGTRSIQILAGNPAHAGLTRILTPCLRTIFAVAIILALRSDQHMRGRHSVGLAILMAAVSIGCGGSSRTRLNVAAGQLSVSPSILDFGQ